ncbi:cupin domain-containing protein [Sinorhizobium mexicanum]|uniref:Cupin domain-containing protein n=1 Tax=Sinorhizobium mexicanum TaxID=375549 RepID=A0A859QE68_9HYPH|nr:cupin domain-containing protein [Sinorhizobium mexicanum]MBP1883770.1 quercetin dioxygenase-like cupin family protein [Sinorhizobium mexicanum]QLL62942.1 cupin domain-containing protein [Sinorhizobium mexicanum]
MKDGSTGMVLRPAELQWVERGNGASTIPLVTKACGSTSMLNGITEFKPGGAIPLHSHNCEESVLVLEGECIAEIDGRQYRLGRHDTTFIPGGVPHRFLNASETDLTRIFWTYASVEATRTLITTGETHPISAEHAGNGAA